MTAGKKHPASAWVKRLMDQLAAAGVENHSVTAHQVQTTGGKGALSIQSGGSVQISDGKNTLIQVGGVGIQYDHNVGMIYMELPNARPGKRQTKTLHENPLVNADFQGDAMVGIEIEVQR